MASPFKEYQGGIQAIPNAYEMMTQPARIQAASIENLGKTFADAYLKRQELNAKQEQRDIENQQKQQELADKYRARQLDGVKLGLEAQQKIADLNQKSYKSQGEALDKQVETAEFLLSTMTSGSQNDRKPENDPLRVKAQKNYDDLVAQRTALTAKSNAELEQSRRLAETQVKLAYQISGVESPEQQQQTADYYRQNPGRTEANQNSPGPFRGGYNFTPETLERGNAGLPTAPSQYGAPSGTRPGYDQKTYDTRAEDTASLVAPGGPLNQFANASILQTVGGQIPQYASRYPGANVGELRDMNISSTIGRVERKVDENGRVNYAIGLNPNAAEDQNTEGAVKFVASMNKTSGANPAELALSLTPEGIKKADDFFLAQKETGLFPKEFSLTQARAAFALQAFESGDSASITSDEKSRSVLAKLATNGPSLANQEAFNASEKQNRLSQSVTGTTLNTMTPVKSETYQPASAIAPPTHVEIPPIIPTLNRSRLAYQQAAQNSAIAYNNLQDTEFKQKLEVLAIQQQAPKNALEIQKLEREGVESQTRVAREEAQYVNQESSARSGLDPDTRTPQLGYAMVNIGEVAEKTFNTALTTSMKNGGRTVANNSDYANAYRSISKWGYDPQSNAKEKANMAESWGSFNLGWAASTAIMREFEIQNTQGGLKNISDRIFKARTATAANYRLFLIGAFRKSTVGLGNPSNFEQGLLLGLIPDPTQWFQFTDNSLARARMLTIYQTHLMHKEMVQNNFKMTAQTEDDLTNRFRAAGIIGPKQRVTKEAIDNLSELLSDINAAPEDQLRSIRIWARKYEFDGGKGTAMSKQFDSLLGSEDGKTKTALSKGYFQENSDERNSALAKLGDYFDNEDSNWQSKVNQVYIR